MRTLIVLASLIATPAMAGYCNQIGQVTQCFNDQGGMTTINQVGSMYLTQQTDKQGHSRDESYQLYDYNNNSPSLFDQGE